jgi:class 3 adenylate cyclase
MKCSNCSFVNEPDAQFCENCGQPLERRCPNCGRPASPRARFCRHCGFDLAGAVRMPVEVRLTGVAGADGGPATLHRAAPEALQQKMRLAGARQEGERKLVTALFSDIVGSTALAATMDPEDWRDVVSGAHQQVSQAVYRYEGTIAQLLGDGVPSAPTPPGCARAGWWMI